ncbi:MAG TPA: hypothetical protein VE783_02880 [Candidatus Limnocylindrales bacterium]|nr:hypothetical protein [Candidatus Limnocylindrales bacterium]
MRDYRIYRVYLFAIVVFALAATLVARRHKPKQQQDSNFDYYLLSLSWAPNYCAEHPTDHSGECRTGNHTAIVLHGLWPQSNSGQPPLSCAPASPVASDVVRRMQDYYPRAALIQHEWEKHGTCSGLSAQDYFANAERAFKKLEVPPKYRNLTAQKQVPREQLEADFASANRASAAAFRLSCHTGELVAVEVCLNKQLDFQACTQSVRECPSPQVTMQPVR